MDSPTPFSSDPGLHVFAELSWPQGVAIYGFQTLGQPSHQGGVFVIAVPRFCSQCDFQSEQFDSRHMRNSLAAVFNGSLISASSEPWEAFLQQLQDLPRSDNP